MNNSRIVRECRHYLEFLSGCYTSVSLVWVPGYCSIPVNYRANELARTGTFLTKFSSIELGMLGQVGNCAEILS